jgi:hypothetical protein
MNQYLENQAEIGLFEPLIEGKVTIVKKIK